MRKLWRFHGGVRLPGFKSLSTGSAIQPVTLPGLLVFPLRQHLGTPAEPVVNKGDYVYKGQCIAVSAGYVSAPVHASTSGEVVDIGPSVLPHTSRIAEPCIVIRPDGREAWDPAISPCLKPAEINDEQVRQTIRDAGIVGLGGAVFPSSVKLKPTCTTDTLIINGAECEPYITCDDVLMRERADAILLGALVIKRVIQAERVLVAVEDNKPEAIRSLTARLQKFIDANVQDAASIEIVSIPTVFPTGGEKQLIKVLTGKEVPKGGLPYQIGVVCMNVGTSAAVYDAIYDGVPLISRIVTVTGPDVPRPGNYRVLFGTPIQDVLKAAGVASIDGHELIMGGPMMGQRMPNTEVPVVKATNCLLLQTTQAQPGPVMPCIRCGACANACPVNLLPQQLYWHGRAKNLDKLEQYHLSDCIECGCCAVVCPSHIPLVHYFRFGKSAIADRDASRERAFQSRVRNEARLARIERIRVEQERRKAARKASRSSGKARTADTAKVPVAGEAGGKEPCREQAEA